MPSRRSFLIGAVAAGVTLPIQHAAAAVAQQTRVIVDSHRQHCACLTEPFRLESARIPTGPVDELQ